MLTHQTAVRRRFTAIDKKMRSLKCLALKKYDCAYNSQYTLSLSFWGLPQRFALQ